MSITPAPVMAMATATAMTTTAITTTTATATANSTLADSSPSPSPSPSPPPASASSGTTRPRANQANKPTPATLRSATPAAGSGRVTFTSANSHLKSTTPIPVPVIPPIPTSSSLSTNTPNSAPSKGPDQIAPALAFPSQSPRPANAPLPPAPGSSSTPPTFGILQPPPTSRLQDIRHGHFRDGRIRNPIPSRLKGKTDGKSGKFIVMHMDIDSRQEAKDRDAAAKRNSENTVQAARKAQSEGYRAVRRRFAPIEGLSIGTTQPEAQPAAPAPLSYPRPRPSRPHVPRAGPLTSEETKTEQVRLLPLLRSLDPSQVVERLCSAITFFGGTPGAIPPEDGVFPPSAEGNGQGSLFLGWVSEIFPPLDPNAPRPRGGVVVNGVVRRPRGRPRGSKTKNKGITAMRKAKRKATSADQPDDAGAPRVDDSWVDIDDGALGGDGGVDGAETAETLAAIAAVSEGVQSSAVAQTSSLGPLAELQSAIASGAVPTTTIQPTPAVTAEPGATPAGRRRGRPKGSKNKPKSDGQETTGLSGALGEATPGVVESSGPMATSKRNQPPGQAGSQPSTSSRDGPGRPKGARTPKNKTSSRSSDGASATAAAVAKTPERSFTGSQPAQPHDATGIDNRTPLPAFASPDLGGGHQAMSPSAPRIATTGGIKRKRQPKAAVSAGAPSIDAETHPAKRARKPRDNLGDPTPSILGNTTFAEQTKDGHVPPVPGALADGHSDGIHDGLPDPVHALADVPATDNLAAGFGDAEPAREGTVRPGSPTGQQQNASSSSVPSTSAPDISHSIPKTQLAGTLAMSQSATATSHSSRNTTGGYFGSNRTMFSAAQLNSQHFSQSRNPQQQPPQQQQQQKQSHISRVGTVPSNGSTSRSSPQFGTVAVTTGTPSEGSHNSTAAFRASSASTTGLGKHSASTFQQNAHRGPSASPSDAGGFRGAASQGPQGVPSSSHHNSTTASFSTHQTSSAPGGVNSFASFPDQSFVDISNLEPTGSLGMTANSYGMNANGSQRAATSAAYNLWRSSQG